MPPHNDPNDPHDHPAPSGPTGTTGSSGSSGSTGSSGPTGSSVPTISQTGATFSTDSEFSAVITESNAAQTVTGKINVDDPDAGQACLDLARTLGYSTTSDYYKTGEATRTGSYYGSKTIFTLLSNNQLAVISDGDPYPAEAGAGDNLNNNLISTRFPGSIIEQDFEYKFTYRGGNLNSDASYSDFFSASAMGIQGIFLNGVALYNPSSGNGTVPNTTISGNNSYNLNAAFFDAQYGIDEAGGHPSPQGNVVNGTTGQYHYHDAMFLTSGLWNNETFVSSNAYFSSDYYTDASGNIDYIRHTNGHSKIVGFCFDGYPIYGSYGYDASFNPQSNAVLMTSSYRTLDEAFYGRPYAYDASLFGYTLSAGAFLDDYEYVPGMGSLDDCNGRFCVTPEYPNGTYAYFVLINEENKAVFPYIIGKYSRQQRKVINAGYPADTHDTGGSVIPTTGTEGVFNVSTLGVSKYVSSPINETIVDVSYGSFTIDSSGNWSYTMDGPHDEFVTDVSYNDSIRVYSYDGSANRLVTVTMMGTAEAPSGPTPTPLDANNTDSQCVMYSLNSPAAGEATVSGYSGSATAIVIPAQVSKDGTSYTVTNMDISFFQSINCSSLTIPASVTHIHPFNVGRASTLTNVIVDSANPYYMVKDGLLYKLYTESGNNYATVWGGFNDPTISNTVTVNSVTKGSVTYPVTSIHVDQAPLMFWGATAVIFGDNVTSLGNGDAFHSNTHIVSMTMGANITSIQFRDIQSQFTTLSIGANVTSIASSVFSSITSLTVDPDNTTFKVQDGILYQKVDAANATVFKVFGTVTNVVIPATIEIGGGEGIPVTSIPDSTFANRLSLTAATIGSNVKSIGNDAFYNCSALTAVTIPDAVTSIGDFAFYNCSELTAVTIPDAVTSIGIGAFYYCSKLTAVIIPDAVTSISQYAFAACSALTAVIIPDAVTSIGVEAFVGCSELTHVTIGSSVTTIGSSAFNGCSKLTAVTIGANVTTIGDYAFYTASLTAVTIPASVTYIGERAFSIATLTNVYFLGNNETTSYGDPAASHDFFGYGQFVQDRNADLLVSSIAPDAVAHYVNGKSGWDVYSSDAPPAGFSDIQLFVPEGGSGGSLDANNADSQGVVYTLNSPAAGKATVSGKIESFTTTAVVIPSQVSSGGTTYDVVSIVGAFNGASSLLSVNIPSSVTSIGLSAFEGCGNLVTVIGAQGVLSLGTSAFNNCSSLASAPIGSATSIPSFAFAGCGSLLSVTIPDSVTAIDMMAFFSCGGITSLTLGASVATIGWAAFEGCNAVRTVNVAANFTLFGILSSLPNLSTFNLPSNNTYIIQDKVVYQKIDDNNAVPVKSFRNITNAVIPATISIGGVSLSITSIPGMADGNSGPFQDKTSLTSVTIGANVTSIGWMAFFGCSQLSSAIFLCDYDTTLHASGNANGYINLFYNARFQNIAAGALLYYAESAAGWSEITENPSPPEYAYSNYPFVGLPIMLTTYVEGMDFASGALTVPNNGEVGAVSGGNVTVPSGTADILSTGGTFAMDLTNGNAVVTTLNGSGSASVSIGSDKSLTTGAGNFAGVLSGAGTLKKKGADTLTLSGTNSGFSGPIQVTEGTLKALSAASLGSGAIQLGDGLPYNEANVTLVIESTTADETVSNPIHALSDGYNNLSTGAGNRVVTLTGGVTKNATILRLLGSFVVDSDITGSSANSDLLLGDGTTSSADVTLVSGNTYDYNGPTHVYEGSTLTFENGGVALPNSDVTIDAGATLELYYASSGSIDSYTENSVKSLVLNGTLAINLNATLVAGTYTLLNYDSKSGSGSASLSYSGAPNAGSFNVTGNFSASAYTITVTAILQFTSITSTVIAGSTITLTTNIPVIYSSSNTAVATVNPATGVVTGVAAGTATITATITASNVTQTATKDITVTANSTGGSGGSGSTPTSNVCFPAKTPVMTNLGPVNIEDINPAVHTIRNKKIVAITKTVAHDKNLVRIAKHALGHLYPEKTTLISQNHKVFCQGQMIKAKHLVDDCNVTLVPYNGQVLYNVLLEEHEKMQVNNLIVETLHPEHKVAKLYRFLKNVDAAHHGKFIAAFNKKDLEQRLHR